MGLEHSQGIGFTFSGASYTATSISVQKSRAEIDATTIDMPNGQFRRFRTGKFPEITLSMEWLGMTTPTVGKTADFSITGVIAPWAETASVGGGYIKAACTGYSINAQAGDIIRCSGTFKLSNEKW